MPRMTRGYNFETKIRSFTQSLSAQLADGEGYQSFIILFDGNGSARVLLFECPEGSWHEFRQSLDRDGTAYLFYDPFDPMEYCWLSWRHISRSTMERLLRDHFVETDFQKERQSVPDAPNLDPPNVFPTSWEVMF